MLAPWLSAGAAGAMVGRERVLCRSDLSDSSRSRVADAKVEDLRGPSSAAAALPDDLAPGSLLSALDEARSLLSCMLDAAGGLGGSPAPAAVLPLDVRCPAANRGRWPDAAAGCHSSPASSPSAAAASCRMSLLLVLVNLASEADRSDECCGSDRRRVMLPSLPRVPATGCADVGDVGPLRMELLLAGTVMRGAPTAAAPPLLPVCVSLRAVASALRVASSCCCCRASAKVTCAAVSLLELRLRDDLRGVPSCCCSACDSADGTRDKARGWMSAAATAAGLSAPAAAASPGVMSVAMALRLRGDWSSLGAAAGGRGLAAPDADAVEGLRGVLPARLRSADGCLDADGDGSVADRCGAKDALGLMSLQVTSMLLWYSRMLGCRSFWWCVMQLCILTWMWQQ